MPFLRCAGARGAYARRVSSSIDVVLLAYNRFELTESCLRHLQAQGLAHRVIVVDNGSTDDTQERLSAEWPEVHLECFAENRGFPEACNRGVAAGSGEVVVLLNNDVDVRPDFLERLVEPLQDPTVGSVASLMLQPGEELIDSVGLAADVTLAGFPRLQGLPVARAHDALPVMAGPAGTAAAGTGGPRGRRSAASTRDCSRTWRTSTWRCGCVPRGGARWPRSMPSGCTWARPLTGTVRRGSGGTEASGAATCCAATGSCGEGRHRARSPPRLWSCLGTS